MRPSQARRKPATLLLVAMLGASAAARAEDPAVQRLRQDIQQLKSDYDARLEALERRLRELEAPAAAPAAAAAAAAAAASPAPPLAENPPPAPPAAAAPVNPAAAANAFNPALSLILSGLYGRTSLDPAQYALAGFPVPGNVTIGPGQRGLGLAETELGISANVDPDFRGVLNYAIHPDDSASVEEAFVETTALSGGVTARAGRFFSGIGYLNEQHAHTWDFVDAPMAYDAFLGGQYGDDGIQLRWIAPTDLYVNGGAELLRGGRYPGAGNGGSGPGAAALHLHLGDDVGASSSWRAGVSWLRADDSGEALAASGPGGAPVATVFSGTTVLWIGDFVWKWAPLGNATVRNAKIQAEILRRERNGTLQAGGASGSFSSAQSGAYLQGIYQFMPHWRVGLRGDWLAHGSSDAGAVAAQLGASTFDPGRYSLMFDYSGSEFSRLRLQLARARLRPDATDSELFVQYQMSLGAHGAHSF